MPIVDIDGKTFNLASETLEAMLEAMDKTAQDGNEHGFLMCDASKITGITPGKKCDGNKCSIHLEDCGGHPVIGDFHSHPEVTSFGMGDYLHAMQKASQHPEESHLMCVSLLDKGLRCKALKEMPPKGKKFSPIDTSENRDKIKPYFTKRVNVSLKMVDELLDGIPWEKLTPAEAIIAVDEGEGPVAIESKQICPVGPKPGSQKYKTVKVGDTLTMVPIPPATPVTGEVMWVNISDIETPDQSLIAWGEVKQYANVMSPIEVLEEKVDGKWKIHDGRHHLEGWKMAGYTKAPILVVKP